MTVKLKDYNPKIDTFKAAVVTGLEKASKEIPCKFFYDERGSKLFEKICSLDEYYPTRTEEGILEKYGAQIADLMGRNASLVEFGCGSLRKIRILLEFLEAPHAIIPIDISREHLLESSADLARTFPKINILPVCADFTKPFPLPKLLNGDAAKNGSKTIGFFPGSTIGNFSPIEATAFLKASAQNLGEGADFLVGVDMKKDEDVLTRAYNDEKGVTAAFNLNLLERVNRELDGNFDLSAFDHRAFYNDDKGRMEMHLVSSKDQTVRISGKTFRFLRHETIHTECSHKYTLKEFTDIAAKAGWTSRCNWTDENSLFSIHYLRRS